MASSTSRHDMTNQPRGFVLTEEQVVCYDDTSTKPETKV